MPAQGTQFKNQTFGLQPQFVNGLPTINEGGKYFGENLAATFVSATGNGSNPISGIADVVYTQGATPSVLIPDSVVPSGMRCYITRVDIDMQGATAWTTSTANTSNPYIVLQDTAGHPLVYVPRMALGWPLAEYMLPQANVEFPLVVNVASFAAATGVVTLSGTPLINASTVLANTPFTVVSGTGQGQSGIIASYTNSTITPVSGATAFPVALDNTSVIAVWYLQATSGSTTSATFSNATLPASNALDNGFNLLAVYSGNSNGSVRPVISNTSTAATIATGTPFQGAIAAGDIFQISNNSELFGIVDMAVADKWAASQTGKGIQVSLGVSPANWTAGSPLRVYIEGFFAV